MRSRRSWSTIVWKDRITPACMPAGGSFVHLSDSWRRPRGKRTWGSAEMNSRKSGFTVSFICEGGNRGEGVREACIRIRTHTQRERE